MKNSGSSQLTRRSVLCRLLGTGMALPFASLLSSSPKPEEQHQLPAKPPSRTSLSPEDDQFLDDLERSNFCYFLEQANPDTGIVKDRCQVQGDDYGIVGSIAATGFGLTALCIATNADLSVHRWHKIASSPLCDLF